MFGLPPRVDGAGTARVSTVLSRIAGIALIATSIAALAACSTPINAGPPQQPDLGPSYDKVADGVSGRPLYAPRDSQARQWARNHQATKWLDPILKEPQARWLNGPDDLPSLQRASRRAEKKGQLLVAVVYYVPNRGCDNGRQGAATGSAYAEYVGRIVTALSDRPTVLILEPDAVAADCYTSKRGQLLADATGTLTRAGHSVYIDAGHSGWRASGEMAIRLIESGITQGAGFALNVSARETDAESRRYGEELSDLVGHRPFVIDTSRNGIGPSPDTPIRSGWCNPERQALGAQPSTRPIGRNVARLWIKSPGESDGNGPMCGGETAYAGLFSPRQARRLIAGASGVDTRQQHALPEESTLPWTR